MQSGRATTARGTLPSGLSGDASAGFSPGWSDARRRPGRTTIAPKPHAVAWQSPVSRDARLILVGRATHPPWLRARFSVMSAAGR
jgi:hypothetical protein